MKTKTIIILIICLVIIGGLIIDLFHLYFLGGILIALSVFLFVFLPLISDDF